MTLIDVFNRSIIVNRQFEVAEQISRLKQVLLSLTNSGLMIKSMNALNMLGNDLNSIILTRGCVKRDLKGHLQFVFEERADLRLELVKIDVIEEQVESVERDIK